MHRFFIPPDHFEHEFATVTGSQAHQIQRVLRLRVGDCVTLLDGLGWAHEAVLDAYGKGAVRFRLARCWEAAGEPKIELTLYQAVLKGDHFGWVLQKGTEVGVSRFVPLVCERNVVDGLAAIEQKRERWTRILQEAAEQCGRARIPQLAPPQTFTGAVAEVAEAALVRLIPWEGEQATGLRRALHQCNLQGSARIQVYIGPEGGFTEDEVCMAQRFGIRPVSLGPRILRAETAGLVAAAAIFYHAGDMEPDGRGTNDE